MEMKTSFGFQKWCYLELISLKILPFLDTMLHFFNIGAFCEKKDNDFHCLLLLMHLKVIRCLEFMLFCVRMLFEFTATEEVTC